LRVNTRIAFGCILSLLLAISPAHLAAQEAAPLTSEAGVTLETPRAPFVEQLLKDQKDIWASPFKLKRSDMKWLVPLGAGAALLLTQDHEFSGKARDAESLRPASRAFSKMGSAAPLALASGALWGLGKLTGNSKAATTGQMSAEAMFHTQLAVRGLKTIFNRERPNKVDGQGQFWGGGASFPSGHAATSFAFATVIAGQYKHKRLVQISAYGMATAVSLSRVGGLNHFPTDVLIGGTIGHLVGRFVLNRHKDEPATGNTWMQQPRD
jgi:hypothetical protein